MKITEAFTGEHGVFYSQFEHLEQTLEEAHSAEEVKAKTAVITAALASHALLEDELLFAMLEGKLSAPGPLAVMRLEHETIETTLQRIQQIESLVDAQRLVREVLNAARLHFAKEERVLFGMAHNVLGEAALLELGRRWAERRGVGI